MIEATKPRQRLTDDAYMTPRPLARELCKLLETLLPRPQIIIEPSAGEGAFVVAARETWPKAAIVAFDIRAPSRDCMETADISERLDWLEPLPTSYPAQVSLILGNPPWFKAQAHIQTSRSRLLPQGHLAFLLRLSLLGGLGRARTLWNAPGLRYFAPVAPRPSYTHGGNDTSDSALFVWEQGWARRPEMLDPVIWTKNPKA